MTNDEYNMLVQLINDADFATGKVMKINGQWYGEGEKSEVPAPVVNMPHWTEGTRRVVIEGRR